MFFFALLVVDYIVVALPLSMRMVVRIMVIEVLFHRDGSDDNEGGSVSYDEDRDGGIGKNGDLSW